MNDRLILFVEVFPNAIQGIELEDLVNLKERKKLNKQLLKKNKSIGTSQKQEQSQISKPNPKKITIVRNSLTKLAILTGVSRRSLERGLSNFFVRNYSLHNISPYSRDFLVFGKTEDEELSKNKKTETKKQRLKKKKIIRIKSKIEENKSTKAKKIKFKAKARSQKNKTDHKKVQINSGTHLRNNGDNRFAVNQNLNILGTRSDIPQNNEITNTILKFSPIPRKRDHKYIGQIYSLQEEKYISIKSPLHMLCELSQIHKKSRSNYLFQNTILQPTNTQNAFPESTINYQQTNNTSSINDNNLLKNNFFHL